MEALRASFERGAIVAGVLSGTSADGIDVAITRIRRAARDVAAPQTLAFSVEPFPEELRRRVRAVLDASSATGPREVALLSRDLGRAFGSAARRAAERAGVALDLVASHGQTVWHHDGVEPEGKATLQLGDGDFVAEEAGCAVASDFRQRDVAAGGEGAPLSALADGAVFAHVERPAAILNLGGMANLTLLGASDAELVAFDTGPAGSLLDGLARRLLGEAFDRDGARAGKGSPRADLVQRWLEHPFFRRAPPKSTGRDTFGEAYVSSIVASARDLRPEDVLASAVELVAASVGDALERFLPPVERLLVAGGGVKNPVLLAALARRVPCAVASSAAVGVDPKAREALVFAVLGARCALGIPSTHPGATGARAGRVLGKLSAP
ncbi:MAG TPA: anhydro-N-acetylmuramic acid kinase [Planctomycetota bacterium]|jgi:anhydro-N-acetylmuramic acid kinase|nr:anhydro-N-acetylmuramic acid kinase [Planctomycetota bacterium]